MQSKLLLKDDELICKVIGFSVKSMARDCVGIGVVDLHCVAFLCMSELDTAVSARESGSSCSCTLRKELGLIL